MTKTFDAIVIGTGQAGPSLTGRLADAGMTVAVAERGRFGGTCVNVGCTPTKALVASARAAYMARRAGDFGVGAGPVTVDMKRVKARKDEIVRPSTEGIESMLDGLDNVTVYRDHARFESPHRVRVGDEVLEADRIFINVGARARVPEMPGIDSVPYLTNSEMMEVDFLPEHLVVLGGSYLGLEFAQMYRRFGSAVTVIEQAPRLVSKEDEDVSEAVREILENEGIRVVTGAADMRFGKAGEGVRIALGDSGSAREVTASHLMIAAGRIPNTDDLGLEAAGVDADERGFIAVDDRLATSVEGVWAMGDCANGIGFTHTSYNDYEIVADNLLDGADRRVSDRILAYAMYIDPPLARVGMTEDEVRRSGRRALRAFMPMKKVARARERSETQGFMKILIDAESERLLGASLLGIGCDEVIHSLIDVMYADAPYTLIRRAVPIHPTVSELIPTMLADLTEV